MQHHRIHEFFTCIKKSNYKLMLLSANAKKIHLKAKDRMEPKGIGISF